MTRRYETDASGGRVVLEVGGALNSGRVPGESEANSGVAWRLLWQSGALQYSFGCCMRLHPGGGRVRGATETGNPVSS